MKHEENTIDNLINEMEEVAQALRDTFRHNRVVAPLQEWREEQVTRLEACIAALKLEIPKPGL